MNTTIAQQVAAKLAALGGTANDVATILEAAGITGRRGSATNCPIANYLGQAGLGIDRAVVGHGHINVRSGALMVWVPQPAGASAFVKDFDRGEFADLEYAPGGEVR